jgi:iron complex transport system permease protein
MTRKHFFTFVCLLGAMFFLLVLGLFTGSFQTDFQTIIAAIFRYNPDNNTHFAIIMLRLPRLLMTLLVGGSLALSGYLMQALTNNPLADPYILGTAAGASLGANVVFFGLFPVFWLGFYLPSLFAFLGALAAVSLAVLLAYQQGRISSLRLLLGGVAISSLCTSLMSLLTFFSDSEVKLRTLIFWIFGSFENASWQLLMIPCITLILIGVLSFFLQKHLQILFLGESQATYMGVNIVLLKWLLLGMAALGTGVAVAVSGAIGFVGLMIPHIVRQLFGITGKMNVLFVVFFGAVFMLACDLLARWLYAPAGLPIGIITSFLGIPFFLIVFLQKNK